MYVSSGRMVGRLRRGVGGREGGVRMGCRSVGGGRGAGVGGWVGVRERERGVFEGGV